MSTPPVEPAQRTVPAVTSVASFADLDVARGAMATDAGGTIWFGGPGGVFRFDGDLLTRFELAARFAFQGLAGGPADIAFLASAQGLVRVAGEVVSLIEVPAVHVATSPAGIAHVLTPDGRVGVLSGGVRMLVPGVDHPPDLRPTCLGFDPRGNLVIGTASGAAVADDGAWRVLRSLVATTPFATDVRALVAHAEGLWIGAAEGVYEYRGGTFTLHRTPRPVQCLCFDGDEVWIGMAAGGLGRLRAGELDVLQPAGTVLESEDVTALARTTETGTTTIWVQAGGEISFVREGELQRLPT